MALEEEIKKWFETNAKFMKIVERELAIDPINPVYKNIDKVKHISSKIPETNDVKEEVAKPEIKAEFNPDKAEDYFNALVNIAEQRKCSGYYGESDNWFEVSRAREALGLPEEIPEIDDADF